MVEFHVVDSRLEFASAVDQIASGRGPVAVDAERASGYRYSQRAYLIQVYRRGAGTFLFDPPQIQDFTPLQQAIERDEWVLHAASQDLPSLREVGMNPERVFDTELAARLLNLPKVGLGAVVDDLLGVKLAKEHSASDWSTRPLPQSWLRYAALDVELLVDVRDALVERLDESGKTLLAYEEFEAVLHRQPKPGAAEPWRRLSGLHTLRNPRSLAVARELWLARDAYAAETDIAPGRIMPDAALVAAAKALPRNRGELVDLREFTGRASRSELKRWWAAIEAGLESDDLPALRVPSHAIPPPRAWQSKNPDADARLKEARAAITLVAERMNVPLENLLTPEYLRQVSWNPPTLIDGSSIGLALAELGARPWQIAATAQVIADAFVTAAQRADPEPTPGS